MVIMTVASWWASRKESHQSKTPDEVPEYQNLGLQEIGKNNEDAAALSERIRQCLLTLPSQVPQNLQFGSYLPDFLDSPQGQPRIRAEIRRSLERWIPEIVVESIEIDSSKGDYEVRVNWRLQNERDVFQTVVVGG